MAGRLSEDYSLRLVERSDRMWGALLIELQFLRAVGSGECPSLQAGFVGMDSDLRVGQ